MSTDSPLIQYDDRGVITDWGPANATTLIEVYEPGAATNNQVLQVDAWKVFFVTVWIRNSDFDTPLASTPSWQILPSFSLERWDQILPHFERFHTSAGIARRFQWGVEGWLWPSQNGWEPDDYL